MGSLGRNWLALEFLSIDERLVMWPSWIRRTLDDLVTEKIRKSTASGAPSESHSGQLPGRPPDDQLLIGTG
jgi:hypothetical protein